MGSEMCIRDRVITGRALYEKCLDLRELIAITEDPEHVELEHD